MIYIDPGGKFTNRADEQENHGKLEVIEHFATEFYRSLKNGEEARHSHKMNIDAFVSEYLLRWSQHSDLGRHAAVVKHSGFKNENEFRIVSHVPEGETVNMTFSQKRSIMARHYALFFPSDLSKEKDPLKGSLPIQEVMIGPSRHQKISEQGVRDLLLCCGYQNVTMSCSKVPYQQI